MPRARRPTAGSTVPSRDAAARALGRLARKEMLLYTELEAPLRRAVLLYWGNMGGARRALGLRAPLAPRQAWSRERVLVEIRKLHRSGQHMSTSAVIAAGRSDLVIAAGKYVGSWVRARTLAGVGFKAERSFNMPIWDAATVVAEIQARHREQQPLASSKAPKSLPAAARRIFGSWRSATEAAGFDYNSVLLLRHYGDDELLAWLRKLARRKPHMTLCQLDKHGGHTVACRRRWGSLERAARAAGLSAWPVRTRRAAASRDSVIQLLRKRSSAGQTLELSGVRAMPGGHYIINSVFHHFTTWNSAIKAAGLPARASKLPVAAPGRWRTPTS